MNRTKSTILALVAVLLSPIAANADLIEYTDFSDFSSTTITSDVGGAIDGSANFTENGGFASNNGVPGLATSGAMVFTGFSAFEVGMFFGNDQNCCGSGGIFDAVLSIFFDAAFLGSVAVTSNGNDFSDQFIGLGSGAAFNRVELDYGTGSGNLARFITRIDFGYDQVASVPEPGTLALLGIGLLGMGAFRRRREA